MNILSFKSASNIVKSNTTITLELVVDTTSIEVYFTTSDSRAVVDSKVLFTSPSVSETITVEVGQFAPGETFTVKAHALGGTTALATFVVDATSVASIVADPINMTSAGTVDLTVTLNSPSNVGGTYVRLSQKREQNYKIPLITDLPVSLTIAPGNLSETITCNVTSTSLFLRDTIFAEVNGVTVSTEVSING